MQQTWTPWHQVVTLRDDLRSGELSMAVFAADLYDVVMRKGQWPTYEEPDKFFELTYPTYNLRELVKDVALRLAGKSDKAYRKVSVNYGGGKTHTLITLKHLVHDPDHLPKLPAVREFTAHVGFEPPKARVAALCFDKIDVDKGVETPSPDGVGRMLKHPWSILVWQLAGADGLRAIHAEGKDQERDAPPAEQLLVDMLTMPRKDGLSTLVLLDEVLMYLRNMVGKKPEERGRLMNFFQCLTQAVVKVDRCAMVASLLASKPAMHDDVGKGLLKELSDVFGRQMEEEASPVGKEDVAEVLRRRFFEPDSIRDSNAFRPHVTAAVGNIAAIDERIRKARPAAEARYLASFPFHPDLTEVFYSRWTQLDGFQRTRGILRTFATALRDAETWDTSPLVGANVFLGKPGKDHQPEQTDLAEAARQLCQVASVASDEGATQQWAPILEGELAKARTIQSEAAGLRHREIEQAVIGVFLNSQPIGHKALTPELIDLVGPTRPDKIELEKALRRWTERSWFLDEAEAGTAGADPDGAAPLPKAWRLGNRPNLRQMHHDACATRVPPDVVDAQLIEAVRQFGSLTRGASAAGVKVHTLPARPRDIQDDGEFHYAVLGLEAASDSGKPNPVARRCIDETTTSDRPRVYRNAVVLAVPSIEGLDAARTRVREHLGWIEVQDQLKGQTIEAARKQMLTSAIETARMRIPEAIRQAWSIVVTVNEDNDVHAFKITIANEPLFTTIKADKRARMQETAISSDAMLPGGPYDLWHEGETSRRVKALAGAFAQFPKLPKMLRQKEILDTVVQGVQDGIWAARITRPDRSVKTFWRTPIDEPALKDSGLEVVLPEAAVLTELAPDLFEHRRLPGLWSADAIAVSDVVDYFAGGRTVTVAKEHYEDTVTIPRCEPAAVEAAIGAAVERGILWLVNGPASVFREPVPAGVLAPTATLQPPPDPIVVDQLSVEAIPQAWKDGRTNALAISTTLSATWGKTLPWPVVRDAIDGAINARWLEPVAGTGAWPCDFAAAQQAEFRLPAAPESGRPAPAPPPPGRLVAEATLPVDRLQDLADELPALAKAAVGHDLTFHLKVQLGGDTPPGEDAVARINALLANVSDDLKLR